MPVPQVSLQEQRMWGVDLRSKCALPEKSRFGKVRRHARESPFFTAPYYVAMVKLLNHSDAHREAGAEYLGVISGQVDTLGWLHFLENA